MRDVKISIIVPVYNVVNYLEKCIRSLMEQTLKEIEIICIDDGSSDGSDKLLDKLAGKDDRVIVIHQKNKGVSAARNLGIGKARGEYIAFVDSDDFVEKEMCEDIYGLLQKKQADIAVFGGEVFTEDETDEEYLKGALAFFKENLDVRPAFYVCDPVKALTEGRGSYPLIWNKVYRKNLVIASGGFSEELALGEDEAFLFAIFPLAERILFTDKKYYHYLRNRPDSATDRLVMDFEKRAFSNLRMAQCVKETWEKYELLEEYEKKYLERYVPLLFDNAHSLDFAPSAQEKYMQQVFEFLNGFSSFAKSMIDGWYEKWYLRDELARSREETQAKQNEIWALINSKNVAEGQVSVLKEVAIGRRAAEEQVSVSKEQVIGRKAVERKKAQKEKPRKEKRKKLFAKIKERLRNAYLENIKIIFELIEKNGLNTYAKLKRTYGEECVFFACAFAGIGDAYLVGCYLEAWLEKKQITTYRFLLGGKAEKKMAEALFPKLRGHCTIISQKEHEWLRNMDRMCDQKSDFYFFHHYDYMQPQLQLTWYLQGYHGVNMRDLYLHQMQLPVDAQGIKPVTDDSGIEEVERLFRENGLKRGQTVLIAPYSTCLGALSEAFWSPIVRNLKRKGYKVCCNCSKAEKPLSDTAGVFIEFRTLLPFVEAAGSFIGFRSGLCDVVSSCSCRMAVVHAYESRQWGDGKSMDYVGIENMGWREQLLELELEKDNRNIMEVQKGIMDYFPEIKLEDNDYEIGVSAKANGGRNIRKNRR